MEKRKIVVDASVVAKWFLEEEYSDKALQLRDDYARGLLAIAAPSLLEYEVLNALRYSGAYSARELKEIGVALNKYGFEIYELEARLKELAIEIAMENNITVYDASYIALAKQLNTVLYTADRELVNKFPNTALHIRQYPGNTRARRE